VALADQVIARYRQVDSQVHGFLHFDSAALKREAQAAGWRRRGCTRSRGQTADIIWLSACESGTFGGTGTAEPVICNGTTQPVICKLGIFSQRP